MAWSFASPFASSDRARIAGVHEGISRLLPLTTNVKVSDK